MLAKRHQISFEFRPDLLLACRLHAGVFEQLELRSVRFRMCDHKSPFSFSARERTIPNASLGALRLFSVFHTGVDGIISHIKDLRFFDGQTRGRVQVISAHFPPLSCSTNVHAALSVLNPVECISVSRTFWNPDPEVERRRRITSQTPFEYTQ